MAVVLEQHISATNGGDEKILVAVVVDIGEGCGHADAARQRDSCFLGDVLKLPAAEVFPQFVSADLIHKVDVVQSVAIDVGNRNRAAVIVVAHPHVLGDIVDGVVSESDPAFLEPVGKLELIKTLNCLAASI